MLVISSREFRQNQRLYFDKVDAGEQVVVQRGSDKAYALTPITEDDRYFDAEMVARIKRSLAEAKAGDNTSVTSRAEIDALLGL